MKILLTLSLTFATSSALKCWQCEGVVGGENQCDMQGLKGELKECALPGANGCFLSQLTENGNSVFTRGCTKLDSDAGIRCDKTNAGHHSFRICTCKGEGCNEDWDHAAGPVLKCYKCNSAEESHNCTDSQPGNLEECDIWRNKGCFISHVTYQGKDVIERDCTGVSDPALYKCDDIKKDNQELHYCNCHGEGCNKDFKTAGANIIQMSVALLMTVSTMACSANF